MNLLLNIFVCVLDYGQCALVMRWNCTKSSLGEVSINPIKIPDAYSQWHVLPAPASVFHQAVTVQRASVPTVRGKPKRREVE